MGMDSESDITDLGDVPKKAGIPPARIEPSASFIKFALKNRDSEAAKILGVQDHSLTDAQIDELDNRVKYTMMKNSGFSSTLAGIWDYVATTFQCLVGQFTGECGFKDFSNIKAARRAMRTAKPIYEALRVQGPDGISSFTDMAERVSGIKPDGKGGFVPVLDERGNATGFYKVGLDNTLDPKASYMAGVEDRGLQPSFEQRERSEAIYQEEVTKLYKDAEVQALVKKYRPNPLKPGKDTEAVDFVNDPRIMRRITAIADRFMTDDALKKGGSFKYDRKEVREKLIGRIKWRIAKEHKEHSRDIPSTDIAADATPSTPQLGSLPSPEFKVPVPEDTSRARP